MSQAPVRGRFLWHDLMTPDPATALLLYPRVVGWQVESPPSDPGYTLLVSGGIPRAGVMRPSEDAEAMGAPPNWTSYIGTPDADASAQLAVQLGGRMLRSPSDVPGICRFAILEDPQGAVFGVYQPLGPTPPDAPPVRGDFSWHELACADADGAFGFYAALFGWERTESLDLGPMGTYEMFGLGGQSMGAIFTMPQAQGVPPHWLPYALVEDSHRSAAAMEGGGGRVVAAPRQIPGGDWVAKLMDPQGALFAVHSRATVAAAAEPAAARQAPRRATAAGARRKPRPAGGKKKIAARKPARRAAVGSRRKSASKPKPRSRPRAKPVRKKPVRKKPAAARRRAGARGKVAKRARPRAAAPARKAVKRKASARRASALRRQRKAR